MTPPTATTTDRPVDRYPTRNVSEATIRPRQEPVVWGDGPGPLDPDLVTAYEDDGFLVLPGVFGPNEVQQLNEELDRLAADEAARGRPEVIVEPDSNAFRSLFAFHTGTGPLADAARHPWLVGAARQLLGSDVYVHQSRANLKPGFRGREFYWHSDFETWHAEDGMPAMRALSCSVTLTDNHPWNGPLLAIAGSHRWFASCVGETPERHHEQSLRRQQYGTPDDDSLRELVDRGRIEQCIGPAGTVVLFDCNLMHGSTGNISPLARRNLFVVFNSVENRLVEPFASAAPRPEYIATRRQS